MAAQALTHCDAMPQHGPVAQYRILSVSAANTGNPTPNWLKQKKKKKKRKNQDLLVHVSSGFRHGWIQGDHCDWDPSHFCSWGAGTTLQQPVPWKSQGGCPQLPELHACRPVWGRGGEGMDSMLSLSLQQTSRPFLTAPAQVLGRG